MVCKLYLNKIEKKKNITPAIGAPAGSKWKQSIPVFSLPWGLEVTKARPAELERALFQGITKGSEIQGERNARIIWRYRRNGHLVLLSNYKHNRGYLII